MDYRALIAEAIVVLRRRVGLNAKDLAAAASMGPSQVSRIELCKTWVTLPVLIRITKALGMSLGEFFSFAEEQALSRGLSREIGDRYPPGNPAGGIRAVAQGDPKIEYPPKDEEPEGEEATDPEAGDEEDEEDES